MEDRADDLLLRAANLAEGLGGDALEPTYKPCFAYRLDGPRLMLFMKYEAANHSEDIERGARNQEYINSVVESFDQLGDEDQLQLIRTMCEWSPTFGYRSSFVLSIQTATIVCSVGCVWKGLETSRESHDRAI